MGKATFYAVLFTLFLWLGGIIPATQSAPETGAEQHGQALTEAVAVDEHGHPIATGAAGGGAHAAGAHPPPFILDIDFVSAIVNLLVFLLLLAVLAKFVWPPILKGLQQRDEKIRGDLEGAERANRDAQATLQQYKTQLAEAQREAQRIIDQSKTDAQRVAAQLKTQAEAELKSLRDRAQADINTAKEQAIAEVYEQTATLATQVASQILRREVRPEDHQELVQRSLSGLETAQR